MAVNDTGVHRASVNESSEPSSLNEDPIAALIHRCAASLDSATRQVERNPGRAAVHAVRVAVRRLRSVLRVFRKDLHPILHASLQFELGNLSRSLATLRDVSVRLQLLRALLRPSRSEAAMAPVSAMAGVLAALAGDERDLQAEARRLVGSGEWAERKQRIHDALSSSALLAVRSRARRWTGWRLLGRSLKRVSNRLRESGTARRELHRLRLAVKQARYLADVMAEATGLPAEPALAGLPQHLRKLQDSLGDINDHFGLHAWTLTAGMDPSTRRALVRALDARIVLGIASFRRLRKKLREPIKTSAVTLLAYGEREREDKDLAPSH
jgi:CHAD domain-containing protein